MCTPDVGGRKQGRDYATHATPRRRSSQWYSELSDFIVDAKFEHGFAWVFNGNSKIQSLGVGSIDLIIFYWWL